MKIGPAIPLSPFGKSAPFFEEEHRAVATATLGLVDLHDAALHDAARVGVRMGELGLYKHLWPASVRTLCAVREILAYASPLADAVFAVQGLGITPLARCGRDDLVKKMIAGEKIGAFALTEPEAGSDVAAMRATAKKDVEGFVLDGEKTFISNVGIAHHFVVFANAAPELGRKGISAFLVPAHAEGLELVKIELS